MHPVVGPLHDHLHKGVRMQAVGLHKVLAVVIKNSESGGNINSLRLCTKKLWQVPKYLYVTYPIIDVFLHPLNVALERVIQLEL